MDYSNDFSSAAAIPGNKSGSPAGKVFFGILAAGALIGGAVWAVKDKQKKGNWFFQRWILLVRDAKELKKLQADFEQMANRNYENVETY